MKWEETIIVKKHLKLYLLLASYGGPNFLLQRVKEFSLKLAGSLCLTGKKENNLQVYIYNFLRMSILRHLMGLSNVTLITF